MTASHISLGPLSLAEKNEDLDHCLNVFFETKVAVNRNGTKKSKRKKKKPKSSSVVDAQGDVVSNLVYKAVVEILRKVHTRDPRFMIEPICMGSYYQRLKVGRLDEFDFCVRLDVGTNLQWSGKTNKQRSKAEAKPEKGQVFLSFKNNRQLEEWKAAGINNEGDACITSGEDTVDIVPFMVKRRCGSLIQQAAQELNKDDFAIENLTVERSTRGPATTLKVKFRNVGYITSIDLSPIIEVDVSLPGWPRHGAQWPSASKVNAAEKQGLNLVPKADFVWSVDTLKYENKLLQNVDKDRGCRKKSEMILKKLKENWCHSDTHFFRSYCLKNALFWECEQYPNPNQWPQARPAERVMSMTTRLLGWLRDKTIPWYFYPEIDVMGFKEVDDCKRREVIRNIESFLDDPKQSLKRYN